MVRQLKLCEDLCWGTLKERYVEIDQISLDFAKWCYIFQRTWDFIIDEAIKKVEKTWVDVKFHELSKKRT